MAIPEPQCEVILGTTKITLLGTAHVSQLSVERVRTLIEGGEFDAIAVELCRSRQHALLDPEAWAQIDLFSVIRQQQVSMMTANLALASYQQRLAEQLMIEPGAEQRLALNLAQQHGLPVLLIDRDVGITLKRIAAQLGWWQRATLFIGLFIALITSERVTPEEVERLKDGDVLDTAFAEFASDRQSIYLPLVEERDRYMAAKLRLESERGELKQILAVVGVGHLRGITTYLNNLDYKPEQVITELEKIPPPSRWLASIPWILVGLILIGFSYGFLMSPKLGWDLIITWVLAIGSFSAIGTLLAAGHPLTILAAFVSAPITTLQPGLGVGMVTGLVELFLRKPQVGDFTQLRHDLIHISGWWRNRVARIFLIFLFSTLGAGVGTYLASFQLVGRLFHVGA